MRSKAGRGGALPDAGWTMDNGRTGPHEPGKGRGTPTGSMRKTTLAVRLSGRLPMKADVAPKMNVSIADVTALANGRHQVATKSPATTVS